MTDCNTHTVNFSQKAQTLNIYKGSSKSFIFLYIFSFFIFLYLTLFYFLLFYFSILFISIFHSNYFIYLFYYIFFKEWKLFEEPSYKTSFYTSSLNQSTEFNFID